MGVSFRDEAMESISRITKMADQIEEQMKMDKLFEARNQMIERAAQVGLDLSEAHRAMSKITGALADLADLKSQLVSVCTEIERLQKEQAPLTDQVLGG